VTIKWVKVDPLVMRGEPFCYGTRLTVASCSSCAAPATIRPACWPSTPELRIVGIAHAYRYAAEHRDRYASSSSATGPWRARA